MAMVRRNQHEKLPAKVGPLVSKALPLCHYGIGLLANTVVAIKLHFSALFTEQRIIHEPFQAFRYTFAKDHHTFGCRIVEMNQAAFNKNWGLVHCDGTKPASVDHHPITIPASCPFCQTSLVSYPIIYRVAVNTQ